MRDQVLQAPDMRLAAYAGTSMVLATGVIIQALHQRTNFYSACVYLAQSNACLMILTNLLLICVCAVMLGLQRLFYGPLRPIEIEQLYEKAWFAITETCLAMTIFREEVGGWFLVMFVSLLIGKVWSWIGEGRVDILEQQPPANPRLFHARLSFSLFLSLAYGICMLDYSVATVLRQARPNMMVMFAFEFAVLTITSLSTAARYAISLKEAYIIKTRTREQLEERRAELRALRADALRRSRGQDGTADAETGVRIPDPDTIEEMDIDVPGWEDKGRWVFYLNLTTDFLKLVVYLSFFAILFTFYGLPIHIMRDVFLTLRSFFKRIADFLRYRNATRDMNERYPDATAEDIGREDVCIICREEMRPWQQPNNQELAGREGLRPAIRQPRTVDERLRPKKLPCGHVLHFGCLRSWLERQQICPTCRRPVLVSNSRFRIVPANAPVANNINQPMGRQPQQIQPQQPQEDLHGQAAQGQIPAALNRARTFNLGPFRFTFGHAHGNPFQDQAQVPNNGIGGQRAAVPAAPQQYGFMFGFQRAEANTPHTSAAQFSPASVQAQLYQIERQIMQEINVLRASADQLAMVRALQGELARLRIAQANPAVATTAVPSFSALAGYGNRPMHPSAQLMQATPAMQAYGPVGQMQTIGAGHPDLPAGLTLPEGWTLLPLHRLQQDLAGTQPTPLQPQHVHSHHSHRTTGPGLHPAGIQTQISARFGPTSSPFGLPSPPPLSGTSTANAPPRSDSLVATQASTAETSVPQTRSEQPPASSEDLARLIADRLSDVPGSDSARREHADTPHPAEHATNDGNQPADGTAAAEIGQAAPTTIPIWGTAVQGEQEAQDNVDGTLAAASTSSEPSQDAALAESTPSSQAKGKSRAATVEDFIDEVD